MSNNNVADRHCSLCEQPDNLASMIECARCHNRYHNSCAGVQDGTSATSSPFYCEMCVPRHPAPSVSISSSASTTASAREARLQLQMQKLADEKRLQERLMAEREEAEKQLQEKALRLEKERTEKSIADKIELEKVFITRKYDLLLAQVDEEEEDRSVRSRRSSRRSVQAWIDNQPATLNSNSGERIPTGITSQQSGPSNQPPVTSAPTRSSSELQSRRIVPQPSGSPFASASHGPTTSTTPLLPSCNSTPYVQPPLAANPRSRQPMDVDVAQEEDHNRTYSVQIDHTTSRGNALEVEPNGVDKAVQLAAEVKTVHERAEFQIRHLTSNFPEVLRRIGEQNNQIIKSNVDVLLSEELTAAECSDRKLARAEAFPVESEILRKIKKIRKPNKKP
nr:uncharacterized protein LOC115262280 [Aedes albopictus]